MKTQEPLFSQGDLDASLDAHRQASIAKLEDLEVGQFLANDDEAVVAYVMAEMGIEPVTLFEDRSRMAQAESKMDVPRWMPGRGSPKVSTNVPSIRFSVSIPFTGDAGLFRLRPLQYRVDGSYAEVREGGEGSPGEIVIVVERPSATAAEEFKQELDRLRDNIRFHLSNQKVQIERHMAGLPTALRQAAYARRQRLQHQDKISQLIDIPVNRRPGVPDPAELPIKRRIVVQLAPAKSSAPEYRIEEEVYEGVLSVIRHEAATFETTRQTFQKLGEEDLRNILLAHLNGHYMGEAKGEAFRGSGKTDILIEYESRAAFVAECKLWKGAGELGPAVDQLLGYLTWRDARTALVLFNKEVSGFSEIQGRLAPAIRAHPRFVSEIACEHRGEWRFTMKSAEDDARQVTVHVFLFDLYVPRAA